MLMLIYILNVCNSIEMGISIHLMLMLIGVIPAEINTPLGYFNTSHVNVNQTRPY